MEPPDAARAAEIHVFGWREAFFGILTEQYLFGRMGVAASMKRFEEQIQEQANKQISGNESENYVYDDKILKAFMTIGPCREDDGAGVFELWGLYVDPFFQRRGIGTEMIKFCEEQAVSRGFGQNCLWVLEPNLRGRAFYKKCGYAWDGTRKFLPHVGVDELRYTKNL